MLQYGICRRYYVTVERRLWPGVVSHLRWSPAQTAFTNTHRSTRRPPLDKQRRSAIITSTTVICRVTHNSRVWQLAVQCPLMFPQPADDHTHRRPPRHSAQWVIFSATGEGSNLNVVARCLLYFTPSCGELTGKAPIVSLVIRLITRLLQGRAAPTVANARTAAVRRAARRRPGNAICVVCGVCVACGIRGGRWP